MRWCKLACNKRYLCIIIFLKIKYLDKIEFVNYNNGITEMDVRKKGGNIMDNKTLNKIKDMNNIFLKLTEGGVERGYKSPSFRYGENLDFQPDYTDCKKSSISTNTVDNEPIQLTQNYVDSIGSKTSQGEIFRIILKNTIQNDLPVAYVNGRPVTYKKILGHIDESVHEFLQTLPIAEMDRITDAAIEGLVQSIYEAKENFENSDTCAVIDELREGEGDAFVLSPKEMEQFKNANVFERFEMMKQARKAPADNSDIPESLYEENDDGEFEGLTREAFDEFDVSVMLDEKKSAYDPVLNYLKKHTEIVEKYFPFKDESKDFCGFFRKAAESFYYKIYSGLSEFTQNIESKYLSRVSIGLIRCFLPALSIYDYISMLSDYSLYLMSSGENEAVSTLKDEEYIFLKNIVCGINSDNDEKKAAAPLSFSEYCMVKYILSEQGRETFRFLLINLEMQGALKADDTKEYTLMKYMRRFISPFDEVSVSKLEEYMRKKVFSKELIYKVNRKVEENSNTKE